MNITFPEDETQKKSSKERDRGGLDEGGEEKKDGVDNPTSKMSLCDGGPSGIP